MMPFHIGFIIAVQPGNTKENLYKVLFAHTENGCDDALISLDYICAT